MGEPRAAKPETKRITVKVVEWYFTCGRDFKANGVVLRPGDTHTTDPKTGRETIHLARTKKTIVVPPSWRWREEYEREIEVPATEAGEP